MGTRRAMPVLQVSDVRASAAFYERAGFYCGGQWAEDEDVFFAIVQRGEVTLGLQLLREPLRVNTHWAAYIYVDDAEALRQEFTEAGLSPTEMNRPQHYGCIDFDIRDPDGHLIAFGQSLDPTPGPGLGPNQGKG
ncbi:VOC family protein [Pseudoprimorskyibacter insulae]|uniref:VOC domain-containing protein n=1 Tax=Pseudoprimorskyibacter insulae TaxID=1695997 RepID=A0A2R8AZ39_9RHOB|nr:VOC family protein [Pseudoprimorskyibacter insulae]SPF81315.1 hypothetical protein PRI8871_03138 [Pseudoprimorskyibacter insulae]